MAIDDVDLAAADSLPDSDARFPIKHNFVKTDPHRGLTYSGSRLATKILETRTVGDEDEDDLV